MNWIMRFVLVTNVLVYIFSSEYRTETGGGIFVHIPLLTGSWIASEFFAFSFCKNEKALSFVIVSLWIQYGATVMRFYLAFHACASLVEGYRSLDSFNNHYDFTIGYYTMIVIVWWIFSEFLHFSFRKQDNQTHSPDAPDAHLAKKKDQLENEDDDNPSKLQEHLDREKKPMTNEDFWRQHMNKDKN